MDIDEGYYLASYHDAEPEVVKVSRPVPGAAPVVLRHGFARSYRLDYFKFYGCIKLPEPPYTPVAA